AKAKNRSHIRFIGPILSRPRIDVEPADGTAILQTAEPRCGASIAPHVFFVVRLFDFRRDRRERSGTLWPVLPADAIHIEYSAPAGCPSEAEFAWQVRARVRQVGAPARKYAVVLTVDGTRARGTLRVEEETRTTVRDISGATCDEIAEGLALIMALVIDP